jgi:hypothetical protein
MKQQPIPSQIIHPLTYEEFIALRDFITTIGARLPEDKAPYVWDMFNKLRNENEVRPCTCASSAGHWKRAVTYLYDWVKDKEV